MEKYSKHLEAIVEERTSDLILEKQKTDRLLHSTYTVLVYCIKLSRGPQSVHQEMSSFKKHNTAVNEVGSWNEAESGFWVLVTARKRSCGKVMFYNRVSVIPFTGGEGSGSGSVPVGPGGVHPPGHTHTPCAHPLFTHPPGHTPSGHTPQDLHPPGLVPHLHYGQQVGSIHPTGMLSCLSREFRPGKRLCAVQWGSSSPSL